MVDLPLLSSSDAYVIMKEELREQVREGRARLALSQRELARRAGVNQSVISRLENGKFLPNMRNLVAIESVLGPLGPRRRRAG